MTDDNQRKNIADELARAKDTFRAAITLLEAGLPNDALARTYYAAFHVVRAAVLSRGHDPKTHAGALNLFNRELGRTGTLPSYNRLLTGLQGARAAADYDAAVTFSEAEARQYLDEAEAFASTVVELLRREGWTD